MIELSNGTTVKASSIKKVFVDKSDGNRGKWWTMIRFWDGDQHACSHSTQEEAMSELDEIHANAKSQGVHIGVR